MADDNGGGNVTAPDHGALFAIEGTDKDGCVWIAHPGGRDAWCHNLGPRRPRSACPVSAISGHLNELVHNA